MFHLSMRNGYFFVRYQTLLSRKYIHYGKYVMLILTFVHHMIWKSLLKITTITTKLPLSITEGYWEPNIRGYSNNYTSVVKNNVKSSFGLGVYIYEYKNICLEKGHINVKRGKMWFYIAFRLAICNMKLHSSL